MKPRPLMNAILRSMTIICRFKTVSVFSWKDWWNSGIGSM
ncbi:hypothetical protein PF010_g30755 [Phytophthora fragariae]|uniref:Uncharacterized protein n=1 Tax=Phytophthora fragariae TaxID=53985 RepID=A0A6A3PXH6_9STRA|nr:hypothetical protein PF010_g30755 [Phytophthora fragariae]KAE9063587.1 hypothetical protein PF006_g30905 [Phytophthora fragariae]